MWHPCGSPPRSTDYKMGLKRLQEVNFEYFTSIGILWEILQKSMIWFLRKKYKIPLSPYIFIINI
jgi:hypothetical protein